MECFEAEAFGEPAFFSVAGDMASLLPPSPVSEERVRAIFRDTGAVTVEDRVGRLRGVDGFTLTGDLLAGEGLIDDDDDDDGEDVAVLLLLCDRFCSFSGGADAEDSDTPEEEASDKSRGRKSSCSESCEGSGSKPKDRRAVGPKDTRRRPLLLSSPKRLCWWLLSLLAMPDMPPTPILKWKQFEVTLLKDFSFDIQ